MADGLYNGPLNQFLDAGFNTIAGAYVSLHSTAPTAGGAAPTYELVGNGYARQSVTLSAAASGIKKNSNAVLFGPATAPWTVQYYALWTTVNGGSCLGHWIIRDSFGTGISGTTVSVAAGVYFAANDLTFTLSNA